MVVITTDQRDVILEAVRAMYTEVARSPEKQFHFPTGRAACELLGYPAKVLDALPERAVESFAGVGYPFAANVIRSGDVVLDVGSGSGTDVLIAHRLVGTTGRVIGLDVTPAMRAKLSANVQAAGATNVEVVAGDCELIPLPAASVDVATSNGVLNLLPNKARAIAELARVLRPGGRVQIADIVLVTEAGEACRNQPQLWAECIVGATTEHTYHKLFGAAGFSDVETLSRFDYFAHSASDETRKVAQSFGARAIVLRARKPNE
ncbi:MAG: methyltransferase domain-containing protein [Longimicrobiales bacterium]